MKASTTTASTTTLGSTTTTTTTTTTPNWEEICAQADQNVGVIWMGAKKMKPKFYGSGQSLTILVRYFYFAR